ncbi:MAG TPA: thiamine pyrophosphate-dependent dehydrogenase E1 component subunit alpha [Steroidobacteraceae bacterium]|jgi:TPP-dependent pyruvate/acetoin dehydrogenase alpha subunit|nr:thiamine pyrophosphate-dependent dehydrogenase E1 component subunit alpha [Steroidobacteraceae bacterium]
MHTLQTPPATPSINDLLQMYRALWRIRVFEGQVQRLAAAGEVPGFPHLSTGQEAVAVGVCAHLSPQDTLFTSHRGHGHVLAKGADIEATFAEILGRETGVCRGRGGSMHLVDAAHGVLGATGVVGGNLPLAAGAAWAAQARGEKHISVVFFGDGATGAGVFHETVNLAVLWKLPVLFVCENNGYAEFTSREEHSNVKHVSAFAAPYDLTAQTIDGNDVLAVYAAAGAAIAQLRRGDGPYLLECMTYRMAGHFVGDAQHYRSKEELAAVREKDPIERLKRHLLAQGVAQSELDSLGEQAKEEVQAAVERARVAPHPDPRTVGEYVYSAPSLAHVP